jgi:SAM-dependent methyltransferase
MDEISVRALGTLGPGGPPASIDPYLVAAEAHREAGLRLAEPTRMSFFKKMVLRVAHLFTSEQALYNNAALDALRVLGQGVDALQVDMNRRANLAQATVASIDLAVQDARQGSEEAVDALRTSINSLAEQVAALGRGRAADRSELSVQRALVGTLLARFRPSPSEDGDSPLASAWSESLDSLYEQLETAFRGNREQIMNLQRAYLPDIFALDLAGSPVLDVGCGRAEWLELLRDHRIAAYGVDTNARFVESARKRGLDARNEDALAHLGGLQEGSLGAVTAFHVIEHLPFESLVALVDAALVAVRPGGIVIFETPNPTNVVVGAAAFWIDPTHRHPLHPDFVKFVLSARGFDDAEVRYLHPREQRAMERPRVRDLTDEQRSVLDHAEWALLGPQDYAVIARRPATAG